MRDVGRWRVLGRLLPRDVRERVFEPALADLAYRWLTAPEATRRIPFGLHAMATCAGCIPIVIPRVFVREGRLTRFGHVTLWGGAFLVLFVVVVRSMADMYGAYGPG